MQEIVDMIMGTHKPVSVFLYGSRARMDFRPDSDHEVGVLHRADSKIGRAALKEINPHKDIVVYPFEYESLLQGEIDTPFPERIYLRSLVTGARTLAGERIVESLIPPPIRCVDVLQTLVFETGIALAAVLADRSGDTKNAQEEFSKSCLFAARCLAIVEMGAFPASYDDIVAAVSRIDLGEYSEVVQHAVEVRSGRELNPAMLYKNLSFHNQFVKPKVMAVLEERGTEHVLLT